MTLQLIAMRAMALVADLANVIWTLLHLAVTMVQLGYAVAGAR